MGDGIPQLRDNSPYGVVLGSIFGNQLPLTSDAYRGGGRTGENIYMTYRGIPNINMCKQVLEHFGEVVEGNTGSFYIPAGKSIFGYHGGANEHESGCRDDPYEAGVILNLYID